MSQFTFMEKLLDGVAVEWLPLGEVAQILNGFAFESSKYSSSGIRVIRISDVLKGKMSDKDLKFYPNSTAEEINSLRPPFAHRLPSSSSFPRSRVGMHTELSKPLTEMAGQGSHAGAWEPAVAGAWERGTQERGYEEIIMSKMKNNTTTTATGCSCSHAPAWERQLRLICIPTLERGNEERRQP